MTHRIWRQFIDSSKTSLTSILLRNGKTITELLLGLSEHLEENVFFFSNEKAQALSAFAGGWGRRMMAICESTFSGRPILPLTERNNHYLPGIQTQT